jgi:large subunit ribosomal protein L17
MRHQNAGRKFSRHAQERRALYKNLIIALFRHGRIKTTEPKAKEIRRHAEHLITVAKRGIARGKDGGEAAVLAARRQARRWVGEPTALANLFSDIAPRFAERAGGYTRIVKAGVRLGDAAPMAIIELVDYVAPAADTAPEEPKAKGKKGAAAEEAPAAEAKPKRSRKKKADDEE